MQFASFFNLPSALALSTTVCPLTALSFPSYTYALLFQHFPSLGSSFWPILYMKWFSRMPALVLISSGSFSFNELDLSDNFNYLHQSICLCPYLSSKNIDPYINWTTGSFHLDELSKGTTNSASIFLAQHLPSQSSPLSLILYYFTGNTI